MAGPLCSASTSETVVQSSIVKHAATRFSSAWNDQQIKVNEKDEPVEWRGRNLTVVTDGRHVEVLQRYPRRVDATGTRVEDGKFDFDGDDSDDVPKSTTSCVRSGPAPDDCAIIVVVPMVIMKVMVPRHLCIVIM
jgi:hypothetical protein